MTQEKSYAHSTQWGMEQTQGVPAGWSVMRSGEWISFQRPDGWTQSVTPNEPQYSRGETLFMLLDAMLSAAPQAQPVEAEQAATGAHGTFPAPDLRGIDGATHSEWRFLRVPANEMLIQEKDLPEIIKRACLAYVSQPVQPVREPMSWDLFVAACEAEYGEEFCPNNLGDVSDEEKAELMRVVSIVERHHGIGSKGGAE